MTRYEQGFMRKCAEYGVDGRVLLKHAKEGRRDYAAPVGLIGGTAGGLGGLRFAANDFHLGSLEGAAEEAAASAHLSRDAFRDWMNHGMKLVPEVEAKRVLGAKGKLLSDPAWIKQMSKVIRGENIRTILGAGGKIAGGAAMVGAPLYALTKIIQNLASKKDRR